MEEEVFENLIKESGHNLQLKVASLLKENGWEVEISPYYFDSVIERPREIDIIAWKENCHGYINEKILRYKIFLFIECKYLKEETIFWLLEPRLEKIKEGLSATLGGVSFRPQVLDASLEKFKEAFSFHRYFRTKYIAKLYYTKEKLDGRHDIIYSAFTQALHSLIWFKKFPFWKTGERKEEPGVYYPVVIYEPKKDLKVLLPNTQKKCRHLKEILKEMKTSSLLFEVTYCYPEPITGDYPAGWKLSYFPSPKVFLVDFVQNEDLEDFLKIIEKENAKIWEFLKI